ncbi:M48 family metalloprotease [Amycolatopsis sp. Hca4]|uniref:M48 family metalloprotease n=1 Tax=Amycolatopsis sp. Hca4 TaxID=2742131 RepID=UPI0015920D82|nr:M48 family metalloprotease [Amycolatopsis sp. Hca4]QKV73753.1 M48 family metalloprotease [Amycolatopsis sp. Hca4]
MISCVPPAREESVSLRIAPAPPRLWWVYVLVTLALAATGAGAAEALFVTHDFGDYTAAQACLARNGISVSDGQPTASMGPSYADCARGYDRRLGFTSLAGAAVLPATAWLLMVAGGLATRWRLRRSRLAGVPAADLDRLTERFTALCESQGLTARRQPRLVLAPPATRVTDAFTTGLPGARSWVVVPQAYAYGGSAAFDAVALHELGHVRARDVRWASAAWWAGWLAVPALVLALLPILDVPATMWSFYGGSLVVATVTAGALLAVRAALLRQRELAADRHAAEATGNPDAMAVVLGAGIARIRGVRRVFATHPPASDRLAPGGREGRWDGGFVYTAAAGVVAMLTYHGVHAVLGNLLGFVDTDPRLPADVAMAVAALLWTAVVLPAWTRRAALPEPGWAGSWAGAVAGLVAGFCLQVPGAAAAITAFFAPERPLLVLALAVTAFAIAVLTSAIATRLAEPAGSTLRRRVSWAGGSLAVAVALTATVSGTVSSVATFLLFPDPAIARGHVMGLGSDRAWQYAPVVILAGLVFVTLRQRWRRPRRVSVSVAAATAVIGGAAAALSGLLRLQAGQSNDVRYLLASQRWWICAFAGLVAAVAVVLANRRRGAILAGVPSASVIGLLVTAAAGAIQYTAVRIAGYARESSVFQQSVQVPGWLLLVALIVTLPVTSLFATAWASRAPRRGAAAWTVGSGAVTVLLMVALISGRLSAVTVTEQDYAAGQAVLAPSAPTPVPAVPAASPDHGRPLDEPAASAALGRLPAVLPADAKPEDSEPSTSVPVTPPDCDAADKRFAALEKAQPRTADVERSYAFAAPGTVGGAHVTASVTSYTGVEDLFPAMDEATRACTHFRMPQKIYDGGHLDGVLTPGAAPASPYPARIRNRSFTGRFHGKPAVVISREYSVHIGHNLVDVEVFYGYIRTPPPQAVLDQADRILTDAVTELAGTL